MSIGPTLAQEKVAEIGTASVRERVGTSPMPNRHRRRPRENQPASPKDHPHITDRTGEGPLNNIKMAKDLIRNTMGR